MSELNEHLEEKLKIEDDAQTGISNIEQNEQNFNEKQVGGEYGADFEYDEDFSTAIAGENEENAKIVTELFTNDNLIDEDFEAELGSQAVIQSNIESDADRQKNDLNKRIDSFGIVNVSGSDLSGRPIIVVAACNLPDPEKIEKEKEFFKSQQHFFDLLLEFLTNILERYVESEYTLVYFHYGLKSNNQPSFNWLAKVYKMLDRKFKKNLKALYVVHPSTLFRIFWQFIKPLISSKFIKKVAYFNQLSHMEGLIDITSLNIPEEVRNHDMKIKQKSQSNTQPVNNDPNYGQFQQFKAPLEHIAKNNNGDCIPLCVKESIIFLKKNLDEEGIFRKSGNFERIKQIQNLYNEGQPVAYDAYEIHVAACILKAFFRELPESLLSESIFNELMTIDALDIVDKVEVAKDLLNAKLPKNNYKLLSYLMSFLYEVSQHSDQNKMGPKNLSYVFGPNFLRKSENSEYSLMDIERINSFVELLIKYNNEIFSNE